MRHITDVCSICGAGDRCANCFGSGADHDAPMQTCMGCGGSGGEPPMLPSCPLEGCSNGGPEARR